MTRSQLLGTDDGCGVIDNTLRNKSARFSDKPDLTFRKMLADCLRNERCNEVEVLLLLWINHGEPSSDVDKLQRRHSKLKSLVKNLSCIDEGIFVGIKCDSSRASVEGNTLDLQP